jgi:cyclase
MLRRRLIPKLQLKRAAFGSGDFRVLVTTKQFGSAFEIGDPVSQARIYESQAADELICIDLDATPEGRLCPISVIRRIAENVCMPLTVGGGVKSIGDFRTLLENGADKVCINSSALTDPELITEASNRYGAQCVVVSIDYRRLRDDRTRVYSDGGRQETKYDVISWALEAERRGAGEILLTSIDRDGTREGLDTELTREVVSRLSIPVVTSGGCGLAQHFIDGFQKGGADGVAAGTYFCFKDENPMQTRSQIANAGIPIRLQRLQSIAAV